MSIPSQNFPTGIPSFTVQEADSDLPGFRKHEDAIIANNCLEDLEDLMEKTEELVIKAEKYPEIYQFAKELNRESARLRKEEPKDSDEITNNSYILLVGQYTKEAKEKLNNLNQQLINVKIAAVTKDKNRTFIESLEVSKKEFSLANYPSVVNFYQQEIDRFTELDRLLTADNIEQNQSEWHLEREKFMAIHNQFLKLKDTNSSMKFFIKIADEVLKNNLNEGDSSQAIHKKLQEIFQLSDERPDPKQFEEIKEYIRTVQEFINRIQGDKQSISPR